MFNLRFAGLFGKSWSHNRTRRTQVAKRVTRQLAFLCLEDRRLLTSILGSAGNFAVLGHTTVTNTGSSVIFGSAATLANVGVFEAGGANATTGFSAAGNTFVGSGSNTNGPGIVNAPAAIHLGSPAAGLARDDLIAAYTALASYGTAINLSGQILGDGVGGVVPTLGPGVYSFSSTAQLNGTLKLDAGGVNGGVWVFQIGTDLTTASASAVQLINPGGNLGSDVGVFWVLGTKGTAGLGSATLGTSTAFEGNILALTSITLTTGATIYNGRALARNGAVTLDSNIISNICPPASSSPNTGPGFSEGGLGSIAWEKRATDANPVLLAGATFTITPNPLTGVIGSTLLVVDGGLNDADGVANGVLKVNNVLLGTYTITETIAPTGYAIDDVATRSVTVNIGDLNAVIGVQEVNNAGNTDESDFHNQLGSIAWEKRATDANPVLLAGATFTITPNPLTGGIGSTLLVVDGGLNDADGVANGVLK
ncbi:MAG: ice-binding family protein, partial [Planctomycetota bacterium]|nr:ice-binding family protein [Planctomycetota bacterium]